jgi:ubiquitin C-terminal hydrolase
MKSAYLDKKIEYYNICNILGIKDPKSVSSRSTLPIANPTNPHTNPTNPITYPTNPHTNPTTPITSPVVPLNSNTNGLENLGNTCYLNSVV